MSMAKVKLERGEMSVVDTPKNNRGRGGGSRRVHVYTVKLTRNCTRLSEHVYNISHGQADWYMKTTNSIAEYVGEEYTHSSDIRLTIETL